MLVHGMDRRRDTITPSNPQTQARQTVVWSKPAVQLPKVLHGLERFDGPPLKLRHAVPSPGQRRFLLRMECASGSSDSLNHNVSSPFADAEKNIARLAKGTRQVVVGKNPECAEMIPWDDLYQIDNEKIHATSLLPKFDDMVCYTHVGLNSSSSLC
jgi:hypothetical protein